MNPAFGPIIDATESAWDKVFEVNLKAGFLLSRDVAKLMAKRGGGRLPLRTQQQQHVTTTR